jgi:hypothetical protein
MSECKHFWSANEGTQECLHCHATRTSSSELASPSGSEISERDLRDAKVLRWAAWATEDMMHGSTIREALRKRAEEIEQGKARLPLPNAEVSGSESAAPTVRTTTATAP